MTTTMVLLHGFTGAPASWDDVVAALPPETRVLRETLACHGAPELDTADGFDDEVERIAARLANREVRGAHLCGYSLGARVALGLLARHPERFARATLVGVNPGLATEEERMERMHTEERWQDLLRESLDAFVAVWERQPLLSTQRAADPDALDRQRSTRMSHRAEGLARSLRVLGLGRMPDLRGVLPSITAPVALVAGALDEKFSRLAQQVAPLLPHATVHIIEGAGHNIPLEAPRALAALLA